MEMLRDSLKPDALAEARRALSDADAAAEGRRLARSRELFEHAGNRAERRAAAALQRKLAEVR